MVISNSLILDKKYVSAYKNGKLAIVRNDSDVWCSCCDKKFRSINTGHFEVIITKKKLTKKRYTYNELYEDNNIELCGLFYGPSCIKKVKVFLKSLNN